jgi:hypothetical protein
VDDFVSLPRRYSRQFEVEAFFADLLDSEREARQRWQRASDGLRIGYLHWIRRAHSRRAGRVRAVRVVDWLRVDGDAGPVHRMTWGRSAMLWGPF